MAIQYAKAMGLDVVALDFFDNSKGELVKGLGADFIINLKDHKQATDVEAAMKALTPAKPVSGCVVFAPSAQAISDAVVYVSPGAVVVVVALPSGTFAVDTLRLVLKEVRLVGSIVGTPRDLEEALKYAAQKKVKAHVTEKPFDSVNEVLHGLKKGEISGRTVLRIKS